MQFSDPRVMELWDSMDDKYNMQQLNDQCTQQGYHFVGDEMEYAQKLGMILFAKNKYPEVSSYIAYMTFMNDNSSRNILNSGHGSCSGCGGGQVH